MKTILSAILFISVTLSAQTPAAVMKQYNMAVGEEFLYIQSDRPFYEPGEDVWFTVWVLNARTLELSSLSSILYYEIKDPKGNVVFRNSLPVEKGCITNKFKLADAGGFYNIEASTDYSTHLDSSKKWNREVQVQNITYAAVLFDIDLDKNAYNTNDSVKIKAKVRNAEGTLLRNQKIELELYINGEKQKSEFLESDNEGIVAGAFLLNATNVQTASVQVKVDYAGTIVSKFKSIPVASDKIDLQFLPEAGWLINGIESRVAFKANDIFGDPVSVKGEVYNSQDILVCRFSSEHDGMGSFKIRPDNADSFYVKLTEPSNINRTFYLPAAKEKGLSLVLLSNDSAKIRIAIHSNLSSHKFLIVRKANEVVYEERLEPGLKEYEIPSKNFKMGIHEITVFDSTWSHAASRLVFVNSHKRIQIDIKPDKESYEPREKVELKIKARDENGLPVQGNFSLSVVNEQMLQYSEKYRENIMSSMFLANELKGSVHKPAYYFEKTDSTTLAHLDLLMMTHGWRRIEWDAIKKGSLPLVSKSKSFKTQEYVIRGNIIQYYNEEARQFFRKRIKLVIIENGQEIPVDSNGNFLVWGFRNANPVNFKVVIRRHYSFKFTQKPWKTKAELRHAFNSVMYKPANDIASAVIRDSVYAFFAGLNKKSNRKELLKTNKLIKSNENEIVKELNSSALNYEMKNNSKNFVSMAAYAAGITSVYEINGVEIRGSRADGYNFKTTTTAYRNIESSASYSSYNYFYHSYYYNDYKPLNFYNPLHFYADERDKIQMDDKPVSFYSPVYNPLSIWENQLRDKRKTLFYAGNVETDISGEANIEFYNCDENGSFECFLGGVGKNGYIASVKKSYAVKKPFLVNFSIPDILTEGDSALIPFSIHNQRKNAEKVTLMSIFNAIRKDTVIILDADELRTIYLPVSSASDGKYNFSLTVNAGRFNEKFNSEITILQKGFRNNFVMSGIGKGQKKTFTLPDNILADESIKAKLVFYPSFMDNIVNSLAGMIREPHGCFEQVSSTNYPNILAYGILNKLNKFSDASQKRNALQLLQNGYSKLAAYETKENGFEWYGNTPPHEGLTAYGLLQFHELKQHGVDVSESLEKRTLKWLMSRFNDDGSIKVNQGKYGFAGASEQVTVAYVSWVLSETGNMNLNNQINYIERELSRKFDAYQCALLADIYINVNQKGKAIEKLNILKDHFREKNLQNLTASHSITRSYSQSLDIEILSIAMISMVQLNFDHELEEDILGKIVSMRNGGMYYGNTQATVWALKAMYAWMNRTEDFYEHGTDSKLIVKINSMPVYSGNHLTVQGNELSIATNLLSKGDNEIEIELNNGKSVSYSLVIEWSSSYTGNQDAIVQLKGKVKNDSLKTGDYIQVDYELTNTSTTGVPQTVCIIPVPAGLTLIPEQLKLLKDKKYFSYYEIRNNELIIYYTEMGPGEVRKIPVSFQAILPGTFHAPAASCYLYYNNEKKFYMVAEPIVIMP